MIGMVLCIVGAFLIAGCSNESLLQKAIAEKDVSYCKKMSNGFLIWQTIPGPQANCVLQAALAADDINLCTSENTRTPGGCYLDFALAKRNSIYCTQIEEPEIQEYCLETYAWCEHNSTNWCGRE